MISSRARRTRSRIKLSRISWQSTLSASILITIMVLELKVPHDPDFRALIPLWPVFMSYVLSFIYIGIYWNKLQYGSHPRSMNNIDECGAWRVSKPR
jgi:hypothetical protein